jgi:type IV pilus assembly protein PilC
MENTSQNFVSLDIGLSREDQARIEALRSTHHVKKDFRGTFAKLNNLTILLSKVTLKDKVTFFQLLAVMINAGVPIIRSLYVLADQLPNPKLQIVVKELAKKMEEGSSFSIAMEDYKNVFNESEIGMIASGEASGNLNDILKDIAHQAEKSAGILAKVKGAMIYPAAIMVIMLVAIFLMMTMVVPQLTEIFTETGQDLPTSTKTLIAISAFLSAHWKLIIVAVFAVVAGLLVFKRTKTGKYVIDFSLLYVPIFGALMRKLMISRFARMLASLLKSGIPIVKTLEITANAVGNEVYKVRIKYAAQDVTQGIPLGENLSDSGSLFPAMVASMILVGEKTANIVEVSGKIADFYEDEVDNAVASLSKLMEPVILVVMGGVVGFIVAAIMQPIIGLSDLSSSI